jgi:tetratricopeptide (TPR) repeat protein
MLKRVLEALVVGRRPAPPEADAMQVELQRAREALDAGRADEALGIAEAAAAAFTEAPDPLVLAARIHLEAGRHEASAAAARAALRRAPNDPRSAMALPRALAAAGDIVGAERAYQRAQIVAADRVEFWVDVGLFSLNLGRLEEAYMRFEQASMLAPHMAAPWINLAIVEQRRGATANALQCLQKAVAAEPDAGIAWSNYGLALRDSERLAESVAALRRAAELRPGHAVTRMNFASVLLDDEQLEDAERELDAALTLSPDLLEAHVASALLHLKRGDAAGARACYERALRVDPASGLAQTGLAELELWSGEFGSGWVRYENRLRTDESSRRFGLPQWDGSPLGRGALLVYSEQGIGDMILFCSCMPDVAARVENVVLEVPDKLLPIMRQSFPGATVVPYAGQPTPEWFAAQPEFGAAVAAGSLMRLFRHSAHDYPRHAGYLRADPDLVARWRDRLDALGPGLKVGISWRGGFFRTGRKSRSLQLDDLLPVVQLAGATFVSLQYTSDAGREAAQLKARHGIEVHHWPDAIDQYAETAALVSSLDLVITVCTAAAHLSGALGRPTWIITPATPSWRYLGAGETLPWYPSARLFRQETGGDWDPVIARVRDALATLVGSDAHVGAAPAARAPTPPSGNAPKSSAAPAAAVAAPAERDDGLAELERLYLSGDRKGALEAIERVLAERPEWVDGYLKAAQWYGATGDRDSARDCLELALHHDPACVPALLAKAEMLEAEGSHAGAVAELQRVAQLCPDSSEGFAKLARGQYRIGRHAEARAAAERALALAPDHADALQILGLAQVAMEDFEGAVKSFEELAERYPRLKTVRVSLGSAYIHAGRFEDARRQFEWVIANEPNNALARWDYASLQLANGEFAAGWESYEYRHHSLAAGMIEPSANVPRWAGEPLDGKSLVVFGEQGLGDEIMFASCLPDVLARARRVILTCEPRLMPLFRRSFPGVAVYDRAKGIPPEAADADLETMCGTLPLHFRRAVEDFPQHAGYLRADPADVERWRGRLAGLGGGPAIGVSWRGGTAGTRTSLRSIPLETIVAAFAGLGARLVSLQYGPVDAELAAVAERCGVKVAHFPEVIPDYDQTAALVTALDCVVTVCTSIVHLTGALGRPAHVLVPSVPEWRYGFSGDAMPWYPSARLYRQARGEPWSAVVSRLAARLAAAD